MRTVGHDFELAAGLLFTEGIFSHFDDVLEVRYCVDASQDQQYNLVTVTLQDAAKPDLSRLGRNLFSSSGCGVCGKAGLDTLEHRGLTALKAEFQLEPSLIYSLPAQLEKTQKTFSSTGGIHAAALFDLQGNLIVAREDVGRHNAVDKVMGWAILNRYEQLERSILLVSARAGFEIVQKCVAAQIPVLAAVSAPSSLGVELALRFNLTLLGFLRGERVNLYSGLERVRT
jgi:FdhD protein